MPSGVTEAEVRAMLEEALARIEAGGLKAITIKALTTEGELEHTFSLETEEERDAARLALSKVLGKLH